MMRRTCMVFLCLLWSMQSGAKSPSLTLALNWKPEPQFGGFYAAQVEGYYGRNNLNVEIEEGGSGTPTIQMLLAGNVDYAIVSADEVVIAHGRGAGDIVALFATYQINPQGIMARAERDFKSIEEIVHSDSVMLWQSGLPYAQFIRKKYAPITVVTAPYLGGIGNIRNDPKIVQQCFVTSEPLAAAAVGLKVKTFLVADTGYNPYTTVLVTRRTRWESEPDEVRSMVSAVREGWNEYLRDPVKTDAAMQKLNKAMAAETFVQSAKAQEPLIRPRPGEAVGRMELTRWQTLVDQLVDIKVIQGPVSAQELFVDL